MGTTTDKRTDDETTGAEDTGTAAAGKATETTKTTKTTKTTGQTPQAGATAAAEEKPEAGGEPETTGASVTGDAADAAEAGSGAAEDDQEEAGDETADETAADPAGAPATGAAAGAGAVVAAGLGLASVTGTWLSTLLAERQTLLGQIKLQSGKATDQIAAVYGAPWHTTALVNGVFAVLAMLVAAVVLTGRRPAWVRAVAWGGLVLGLLGLVISAGMYLDLFASMPSLPKGAGGGA
ncbi:hypothetical protein [Streptomyces sp. x-19]|uniref:hypothetical protein n=1 Tax=Streptomyces sp. x-19 TaxID=2789280 RepID=UPI00397FE889